MTTSSSDPFGTLLSSAMSRTRRVAEWLRRIVRSIQNPAEIVKRVKPALDRVKGTLEPVHNAGKDVRGIAGKTAWIP
ncbi:hypothetical protein [Haloactinomyces albus]|uniref:Uncharacterized protein n=1 Tax=Haloactinomyces albus TaxID=1352928 RepID=A0AAE3ZDP9_9ACTN|nr:hypothetical protein [Haloactinomyces albus]MDR7301312.1 hypothetical protein [Haloactinomyces albus]